MRVCQQRRVKCITRKEHRFREKYGELSERELELIRQAWDEGYQNGYRAGYTPLRKQSA